MDAAKKSAVALIDKMKSPKKSPPEVETNKKMNETIQEKGRGFDNTTEGDSESW